MPGPELAWRLLLGALPLPVPAERVLEQPGKPAVPQGLARAPAWLGLAARWAPERAPAQRLKAAPRAALLQAVRQEPGQVPEQQAARRAQVLALPLQAALQAVQMAPGQVPGERPAAQLVQAQGPILPLQAALQAA